MADTMELMRALVARDEAEVEHNRAARLRGRLRDTDLSWLRVPPLLPVVLASIGAAALAAGGGIGAAVLAVRAGLGAALGVPENADAIIGAIIGAALADRDTAIIAVCVAAAGSALLLFLAEVIADLRRILGR